MTSKTQFSLTVCTKIYGHFRLVANGIDIEEKDSLGFTATQLAIILGKEYLLPYLNGEVIDFEVSLGASLV